MNDKTNYTSQLLAQAVEAIGTLPGVGSRSALRLALFLLDQPQENVKHFTTAIIAADIAMKASGAQIGFVDRFSGTLIMLGTVSQVDSAVKAVTDYTEQVLGFTVCPITKT